ncbi:MAG: DUF6797 domain-containing protein [Chthoniobacteraceae bacterium]
MNRPCRSLVLLLACVSLAHAQGAKKKVEREKPDANAMAFAGKHQWADWVERDFPFFSSVLDGRDGLEKENLTPRGIVLNLGHDLWACFDTDLLRVAAIWRGKGVTPAALAPASYHIAGQKTKDGQDDLPKPDGTIWVANGIYPGWQVLKSMDASPEWSDSREPAPSAGEVGRGPLAANLGRFIGVELSDRGAVLRYEVGGTEIREWFECHGDAPRSSVTRNVIIQPHASPIAVIDGAGGPSVFGEAAVKQYVSGARTAVIVGPATAAVKLQFRVGGSEDSGEAAKGSSVTTESNALPRETFAPPAAPRWPQTVSTRAALSTAKDAYVVDDIALPLDNPWKRNIRLADIAFFAKSPGEAAAVTIDGDVWLVTGVSGDLQEVKWKRFASGLHEPMSICIRDGEIFVFDRNGIWKLRDTNGDREADVHEMFCNRFAQTAETREFPNSMKLAPDGSFVISKGGQQGTTLGKHNGTVIRVSPDGKNFAVIGWGLRQPFVGVNPETGLVTASDQEGNYTPTTPLHIIRDHQYYGFLTELQPREQYPQSIADPLTWIPHSVNASGATQVWLAGAKMGPVNGGMIHISYNKPELFRVLMNGRFEKPQAAVVSWMQGLDFPVLNGAVNPADGQLYITGFQIWGTTVKRISGLARVRHTGGPRVLLEHVTPMDKGLLLRFSAPLDKAIAGDVANYSVERWNYQRTYKYGSPHLKLDGTPGQEWMQPSSAYVSKDATSVFLGIPEMKAGVMQMRVGWGIAGAGGLPARNNAYFTPYELAKFEPEKEGFGSIAVDLTPRKVTAAARVKPTKEEGERVYQMMGCVACHSTDGTLYGKVGPTWKGLYGSERVLSKGGTTSKADDAYLKESIVNPTAKVVKGFEKFDTGMPIYSGVLTDSQIESVILFIRSLK